MSDEDARLSEALPIRTHKALLAEGWKFSVPTHGPRAGMFQLRAPDGRESFAVTPLLAHEHFTSNTD